MIDLAAGKGFRSLPRPALRAAAAFLLLCAAAASSAAAPDLLALFQPGDATDVLSGGLALPGGLRAAPSLDVPLSLLEFPTSASVSCTRSRPFRQDGSDRWRVGGSSAEALLNVRDRGTAGDIAVGAVYESSSLSLRESGRANAEGSLSPKTRTAGIAVARGGLAAGVSVGRESHEGLITSTRFVGIESAPGLGQGFLAWTQSHPCLAVEVRSAFGRHEAGLLHRQSNGQARISTVSDGQAYHVRQNSSSWVWAPHWAWRDGGFTAIGLLSWSSGSTTGPVAVGNLVAGSLTGEARGSSQAIALRSDGPGASQMWSFEHTRQHGDLRASAGGFLFPGILSKSYSTLDYLGYERYSLRCGQERRNGSVSLRAGLLLSYGRVDLRLRATQSRFLRPPIVLADERLDNGELWVLAPSVGAGLKTGDWIFDAGASVFFALLEDGIEDAEEPGGGDPGAHNHVRPSYRWGVTVRKLL